MPFAVSLRYKDGFHAQERSHAIKTQFKVRNAASRGIRELTSAISDSPTSSLISSGPRYLQYYQTVALANVDGGLPGVVHVEDVGLLDCHRAIGQIVASEDSGALADLQLNLRCLVQGDILHFLYFNRPCPTECPVK